MLKSRQMQFTPVKPDSFEPRIGGASLLPTSIDWPRNPEGDPLTLVMSLPTHWLNQQYHLEYPEDMVLSVFTTYSKGGYFLDSIVYHGDDLEWSLIRDGYTRVMLHTVGAARCESEAVIPACAMLVQDRSEEDALYTGSKMGGNPGYLQNEEYPALAPYTFVLQLYGGDFPDEWDDIFYFPESVGYLFLNVDQTSEEPGVFFTQCT